jgi:hypothetical protein
MSQETKVRGVADIVFLIDVTGSMQPCIDALRDNIRGFIETLSSKDANSGSPVRDWRARVVGYRDFPADGEANWLVDNEFVRDATALGDQLSRLVAEGGGDEPESLLDALHSVSMMPVSDRGTEDPRKWRSFGSAARTVVAFTDAPYHETMSKPGAAGGKVLDAITHMVGAKIRLTIFCPALTCFEALSEMPGSVTHQIALDGLSAQEALAKFTSDKANFRKTMEQLAKSISKSSHDIPAAD